MPPQKFRIPLSGAMPARILHKSVITAQVYCHRPAADRAVGHKLAWHAHVVLLLDHPADDSLVVIGFLTARFAALEQAVIALCVEQTALVESGALELMVHIGGQDKIVFIPHQRKQPGVNGKRRIQITVVQDVSAPPGPVFFRCVKGIESAGIQIGNAVTLVKIREIPLKAFPTVGQTRGGGQPRARADQYRVSVVQRLPQPLDLPGAVVYRFVRPVG